MIYNESVQIGEYAAYSEWGIVLEKAEIEAPSLQTVRMTVPGRHGVLDLTEELFGTQIYGNRDISMSFAIPETDSWAYTYMDMLNKVHGQRLDIIFDADPDWVYHGLCTVSEFRREDRIIRFKINVDADPYKHGVEDPTERVL